MSTNIKPLYESLNRSYSGPIDVRTVFTTMEDFQEYIQNENTAYAGQLCYIENSKTLLVIEAEEDLNNITYLVNNIVRVSDLNQLIMDSPIVRQLSTTINTLTEDIINLKGMIAELHPLPIVPASTPLVSNTSSTESGFVNPVSNMMVKSDTAPISETPVINGVVRRRR